MGVLPLQFRDGVSRQTLKLTGEETIDIVGAAAGIKPRMELTMRIHDPDGTVREEPVICRIDTLDEVEYFRHGGILPYVVRGLL
jgi:aconitate hydratase